MNDTINGRTVAEWSEYAARKRNSARGNHKEASDSFDRCDTDGFMSQWANQTMARLNEAQAEWADNHGYGETNILLFLDGRVASTHYGEGTYGPYWLLNDEAEAFFGRRFLNPSKANTWAKKAAAMAKKGFRVARVKCAVHEPKNQGKGTNVMPWAEPKWSELKAGQFEILHADWLTELSRQYDDVSV